MYREMLHHENYTGECCTINIVLENDVQEILYTNCCTGNDCREIVLQENVEQGNIVQEVLYKNMIHRT